MRQCLWTNELVDEAPAVRVGGVIGVPRATGSSYSADDVSNLSALDAKPLGRGTPRGFAFLLDYNKEG